MRVTKEQRSGQSGRQSRRWKYTAHGLLRSFRPGWGGPDARWVMAGINPPHSARQKSDSARQHAPSAGQESASNPIAVYRARRTEVALVRRSRNPTAIDGGMATKSTKRRKKRTGVFVLRCPFCGESALEDSSQRHTNHEPCNTSELRPPRVVRRRAGQPTVHHRRRWSGAESREEPDDLPTGYSGINWMSVEMR